MRATQEGIECTEEFIRRMNSKGFSNREILFMVAAETYPDKEASSDGHADYLPSHRD